MKIPDNRLSSHLQEPLLPCYLVSGDEPLLVNEALDQIRAAARAQGFDSRDLHVQLQGFDWTNIAAAGNELSLFSNRRIVELRLPTGKPGREGGAAIIQLLEKADRDLLFIVQTPKLDRQTGAAKWVKALTARGGAVQVWPVGPRELPSWIRARMLQSGLKPDREAVLIIADRVEGNLLAASQEIEKLRLLHGEGAISGDDVQVAVADSSRFDVYQLVDAALSGDTSRAIRILDGLGAEGVEPVIVMWALTRELRVLAGLAAAVEAGQGLGDAMRQFRVWQTRQSIVRACIGRHRPHDFHDMIKASRRADAAAKGQVSGDAWQLATNLVWQLSAGRRAAA